MAAACDCYLYLFFFFVLYFGRFVWSQFYQLCSLSAVIHYDFKPSRSCKIICCFPSFLTPPKKKKKVETKNVVIREVFQEEYSVHSFKINNLFFLINSKEKKKRKIIIIIIII